MKIYTSDELQVINPMNFRQVVSELNKIDIQFEILFFYISLELEEIEHFSLEHVRGCISKDYQAYFL